MRSLSRLLLVATFVLAAPLFAAKVTVINMDPAGQGLNDPTPASPIGGNPGTTVGELRLNAWQRAADIWGSILESNVEIQVAGRFLELDCDASGAVLGSTGVNHVFADFKNAPKAGVLYPVALANKFAGEDLTPGTGSSLADMTMQFNSKIDRADCFGNRNFYYGFDGEHGVDLDFVVVALHEIAHGLGFSGSTSGRTGSFFRNMPNIFDFYTVDQTSGLSWDQMTATQRSSSAISDQNLLWIGPSTRAAAAKHLGPPPVLRVNSPESIAKTYPLGMASFGAKATVAGVTGSLVAVQDAVEPAIPATPTAAETPAGTATDGCSPFDNAASVLGKVAVVDRGRCTFVIKAQNAKAAGAIGLIIIDNRSAATPPAMSGGDRTIPFPVVSVTQIDGATLRGQLTGGVNATISADTTQPLAGSVAEGFMKLYAPSSFEGGSSVYHFDVSAIPNLLMEPSINDDLISTAVDITINQLMDIGWTMSSSSGVQPTPGPPSTGRRVLKRGN